MSRPQVTITLGRTGQVVKKNGSASEMLHSDYPASGTKRSVRDRLGNAAAEDKPANEGTGHKKKRRRKDGNQRSSTRDGVDGVPANPNDLRHKLMRKNMSRRTWSSGEEQDNRDLRDKLSRTAQPLMRSDTRQHMSDNRKRMLDTRQHMPDMLQRQPDRREQISDTRPRMHQTKDPTLLRRIPSNSDDLLQMDPLRKSYPAWPLDGVRRRSPDRMLGSSRGFSPPRNMDNSQHVSSIRPDDATRPPPYIGKSIFDASRHTSSFMTKSSIPLEGKLPPQPPTLPASAVPKASYLAEELTVTNLLHSLGLGKYAILFQAEEVDMPALKQMGDTDLKELGIPMGPRKKILLAVSSHFKRPPRGL